MTGRGEGQPPLGEGVDRGRRLFVEGLRLLEAGEHQGARRLFRRGSRRLRAPYDTMARLAQARLEVEAGRQGMALRLLRSVVDSQADEALRQWAWMEIADLARDRGRGELEREARQGIDAIGIAPGD